MEERKKPSGLGPALEGLSLRVTEWAGSSWAFAIAVAVIVLWAVIGPMSAFRIPGSWW